MDPHFGIVLVTGGCGFVGFHIVRALQATNRCSAIHVLSRNPTRNLLPDVSYHAGDLDSPDVVVALLAQVRPTVIFHAASPLHTAPHSMLHAINVAGTRNLLEIARQYSVRAFVYTSSNTAVQGPYHHTTEEQPLLTHAWGGDVYGYTKALAEQLVVDANDAMGNGSGVKTACLRLMSTYGERDVQVIPPALAVLRAGQQRYQIGPNQYLCDFLSGPNAAAAHVLCAAALLREHVHGPAAGDRKVAGEAFFVSDGRPMLFWDFQRVLWAVAGDKTPPEKVVVVPAWLVVGLALVTEWVYWVLTLGRRTPQVFTSANMRYVLMERTFSIEKARERLWYQPVDDMEEQLRKGIEWCWKDDAEARKSL